MAAIGGIVGGFLGLPFGSLANTTERSFYDPISVSWEHPG
jgi:hypothetical protein